MDYIRANPEAPVDERDQISGARVFDGEDQGKICSKEEEWLIGCRIWKQVQDAAVTAKRLDQPAS